MCVCVYTCIYMYMYMCVYVFPGLQARAVFQLSGLPQQKLAQVWYVCMCVCTYVCMNVCVYEYNVHADISTCTSKPV